VQCVFFFDLAHNLKEIAGKSDQHRHLLPSGVSSLAYVVSAKAALSTNKKKNVVAHGLDFFFFLVREEKRSLMAEATKGRCPNSFGSREFVVSLLFVSGQHCKQQRRSSIRRTSASDDRQPVQERHRLAYADDDRRQRRT
jgi:hypothetical protein